MQNSNVLCINKQNNQNVIIIGNDNYIIRYHGLSRNNNISVIDKS